MSPADVVGTLLALMLLPVAFAYGHARGGAAGGAVLTVAVGSHLALAALSAAQIFLPPLDDTLAFHREAIDYLEGWREVSLGGPSAVQWSLGLSMVYQPFGPSIWLGYVVNQWIYLAAVIQLLKFAEDIGADRHKWKIVLAFSLLPASLLFSNFLLRESFQVLMLLIAVRYLERYRRTGSLKAISIAAIAFVPFGAIHDGFFLFGPIALFGALMARVFLASAGRSGARSAGILDVAFGVALLVIAVVLVNSYGESARVAQLLGGEIDSADSIAAAAERGARTVLPWALGSGGADLLITAPIVLLQFVFAPVVPFMVSAPEDTVALADTLLRVVFLLGTLVAFRRADKDTRRMLLFLVGTYLAFCLVASIGTTTVGTAMRHHLKVFWIIVAIGTPVLLARATRIVTSPDERSAIPEQLPRLRVPPAQRRRASGTARGYSRLPVDQIPGDRP